jgi:hypothetical protein
LDWFKSLPGREQDPCHSPERLLAGEEAISCPVPAGSEMEPRFLRLIIVTVSYKGPEPVCWVAALPTSKPAGSEG